jgi:hypothetical protein
LNFWTALVSGLASQQLTNDAGGDRYIRLIDNGVAMFSERVIGRLIVSGHTCRLSAPEGAP